MRLKEVRIERFRNIVDPQSLVVEDDVTCLVGKNESGKTTILQALHRLNPANHRESKFDLTTEYPRWRLVRDQRGEDLSKLAPIRATFALEDADLDACADFLPVRPPRDTVCVVWRTYSNSIGVGFRCSFRAVLAVVLNESDVTGDDAETLLQAATAEQAVSASKQGAKALREQGETARARAMQSVPAALEKYAYLTGQGLTGEQRTALAELVPKFFYFSEYELLPGESDLQVLAEKLEEQSPLDPDEESVHALLSYANSQPDDFLGDNYDARKAQLQAAAFELTQKVFEYWTQNQDLEVEFDTELEKFEERPGGEPIMHRMLKVLMRDTRHGGIATNFATRSQGFRWFFSFLAAFSSYQASTEPVIVLLDEPGTSLHGEAQKDFLRFIFEELGTSKQVIYTTHSQYMIDASRYEKLRAVEDRATREKPNLGVVIQAVDVSRDPDTILPVQSALGYSINQHLFIGAGRHLAVEGGSDFVYLDRLSAYLRSAGSTGLDPRLKILPVGGAGIMPAFVALVARDLEVSVLLDGDRHGKDAQRILSQAAKGLISETEIVFVAEISGVPSKADIEDLFDPEDYLRLFNWSFNTNYSADDLPRPGDRIISQIEQIHGVYDHVLPAHALTAHRDEFFASVSSTTVERFEALIVKLNATIPSTVGK